MIHLFKSIFRRWGVSILSVKFVISLKISESYSATKHCVIDCFFFDYPVHHLSDNSFTAILRLKNTIALDTVLAPLFEN